MKQIPQRFVENIRGPKWYSFWEKQGFFQASKTSKKPPFGMVMEPISLTGTLHLGHTLNVVLQDMIVRWKRMKGYETLWVPGTEHAGMAAQYLAEKDLKGAKGKTKTDITKEEGLKYVQKWTEEKKIIILKQLKQLGCSYDWSKLFYTLDLNHRKALNAIFKRLYDEALIYRSDRLVNWDPVIQAPISDEEVVYEKRKVLLYRFKVPLKGCQDFIEVSTYRPETILCCSALAISPKDKRSNLIGKVAMIPIIEREVKIIVDDLVDSQDQDIFLVTPAHDWISYQIGLKHHLTPINMMLPNGQVNHIDSRFEGLSMAEARQAVVKAIDKEGLLVRKTSKVREIGISYSSRAVIEPFISRHWFIRINALKEKLKKIAKAEEILFLPKKYKRKFDRYLDYMHDCCISQSIYWGHRIPVWHHRKKPTLMICHEDVDEIPLEVKKDPNNWVQDEDVFNTWFNSFNFPALDWPDLRAELRRFYPTTLSMSGYDILFAMPARNLIAKYMMRHFLTCKYFLHGIIYKNAYWKKSKSRMIYLSASESQKYELGVPLPKDVHVTWEKMSKSKNNVSEPEAIIEEFGVDALRLAIASCKSYVPEINIGKNDFEAARNCLDGLWDCVRTIFNCLNQSDILSSQEFSQGLDVIVLRSEDRAILTKLNKVIVTTDRAFEGLKFDKAMGEVTHFITSTLVSYLNNAQAILEEGEVAQRKNTLKVFVILLCRIIRLLHPVAPFITEEIFQYLLQRFNNIESIQGKVDSYTLDTIHALTSKACIVAPFPEKIALGRRGGR